MKNAMLFLLFVMAAGCTRRSPAVEPNIIGTWELRGVQGGLAPAAQYAPGNGNILEFSRDQYKLYSANRLIQSGKYELYQDASARAGECLQLMPGQTITRIIFKNDSASIRRLDMAAGGKLNLTTGCIASDDGSITQYQRL